MRFTPKRPRLFLQEITTLHLRMKGILLSLFSTGFHTFTA